MISLVLGVILIAFSVFAVLPSMPLNWGAEVIAFLKGCAPVLAAFVGLICLFIGAFHIILNYFYSILYTLRHYQREKTCYNSDKYP